MRSLKIFALLVALNTGALIVPQEASAQQASVAIRENDQSWHHLSDGELQIYRPQVQKRSGNGENPAPSKVMRLNDVRPASERNSGNRQRDVNPTDNGSKNQPSESPDVNPSNKNLKGRLSQSKTNQDEKEAGIMKRKLQQCLRGPF